MSKVCFVISPMGAIHSPRRIRADYVLNNYITPACAIAGYTPILAGQTGQNILQGTTNALMNAPMVIAYLGSPMDFFSPQAETTRFWSANVMIEVGCRIAWKLPVIFMCDIDPVGGDMPQLPMILSHLDVIGVSIPDDKAYKSETPVTTVNTIVKQLKDAEKGNRHIDSMHAVATINAASRNTQEAKNLFYAGASKKAEELFGLKLDGGRRRLVGYTMVQFLEGVKQRMHPAQWKAFERDQQHARSGLRPRATGPGGKLSVAGVPIVFHKHENPRFINRAYLPIIVQDYRSDDSEGEWYSLRVLYLDVTSATEMTEENGEKYYVCRVDPVSEDYLEPLPEPTNPVRIFVSYTTSDLELMKPICAELESLRPYVKSFIAKASLEAGDGWMKALIDAFYESEMTFLMLGQNMGPGQRAELEEIQKRLMTKKFPVVPVRLHNKAAIPPFITNQAADLNELNGRMRRIIWKHLPDRCPVGWEAE